MPENGQRLDIHVGHNIDAIQQQLGVTDEAMLAALGLSYNRFWDMKRREWAQKKTIAQVAAALTELTGITVTPEQVLTGRLAPEQFAERAVETFVKLASELEREPRLPLGGVRLPRLHLGSLPAGPAEAFEPGDAAVVVRSDPGDFVVTADGDCMLPTIGDGDELVCVAAEQADDGQITVVTYADGQHHWQSGVKRFRREGDRCWLSCDNQSADSFGRRHYPDIHPLELRVHGVVVGLWRALR
ncbi:MAG: LexA family transcriptional regulator [Armatimonadetes bacterium]|nr:LexA family transcriptional regulator [Armatimonadota bacterium]